MKLVILDGKTVVGDDLGWKAFSELGELTVYDRTPPDAVIARIGDADAVFLNKVVVTKEIIAACPNLKYIGIFATGYNVVDVAAAKERGVVVTNVPSYSTDSVAQTVFAFILDSANKVARHDKAVHAGEWTNSPDFCFWETPLTELAGKTIGIVGYGAIGKRVGEIAKAFKMNVLHTSATKKEGGVALEYLLQNSDYVSMHCPLFQNNGEMINRETLKLMKPTAYFINTARGGLVNEADLASALNGNEIAGAYLDVVSQEPISAENPVLRAKNCVLTPHIAWAPRETRVRLMEKAAENFKRWRDGTPQNNVAE